MDIERLKKAITLAIENNARNEDGESRYTALALCAVFDAIHEDYRHLKLLGTIKFKT